MLLDGKRLQTGETLETDVCVVGAGAAGMVLAQTLGQTGIKVLLVEAGKTKGGGRSQRLYAGEVSDPDRHLPPDRDRFRGLGGSSQAWGGRCMPFDPVDFAPRPELGSPGWPIGPKEMDPWYRKAQDYVDCGKYVYSAADAGLEGVLIEGFQSDTVLSDSLERWSPPTHFGKTLFPTLSAMPNVTVLTNAVVTGLQRPAGQDRISELHLKSLPKLRATSV